MSESESSPRIDAIVYFVVSPVNGPDYHICVDDELQAMGGVHALERDLESKSYWFVHLGKIGARQDYRGVTFDDSELSQLPVPPESAWHGRLNPLSENRNLRSGRLGKYSKRFSGCWIGGRRTKAPQWTLMY